MATHTSTNEQVKAQSWDDFVGQEKLKARLRIHIEAAILEGRELEPMLLCAPPGTGKTTLAELVAAQLGDNFEVQMMSPRVKEKDFVYFATKDFAGGGVVLLDEIHSAPKAFQEMLLPAIQDGVIHSATGRKVIVNHISFIAATTEPEKVIKPLWDRFLVKPQWEAYTDSELAKIVGGMADRAGVVLPPGVAEGLGRAAGGTPRIAGSLVAAARSLAAIGQTLTVASILDLAEMDEDGLSARHRAYLECLDELGEVAGLASMCSMLQLSQSVVEDLERLLITRQFIRKDAQGRHLTGQGRTKVTAPPLKMASERRRRAS